jgi:SAM-dependent methyltransferase
LERQGPGSTEATVKALSFLDNLNGISRAVDFGCGTGGQTMVLAQNITGNITGVDLFPEFINVFYDNAKKLNLRERVNGIVGSMENISFQKEEFDLIWSEGAVDNKRQSIAPCRTESANRMEDIGRYPYHSGMGKYRGNRQFGRFAQIRTVDEKPGYRFPYLY